MLQYRVDASTRWNRRGRKHPRKFEGLWKRNATYTTTQQQPNTGVASLSRPRQANTFVCVIPCTIIKGRAKHSQLTSVRRLVLISLVRQPLPRWSSKAVFIVFSFVNSFVPVQSDPHLEAHKEQTHSFSGHASNPAARSCCRCSPTLSPFPFCRVPFRVRVDPHSWSSLPKLSLQLLL